MEILTINTQMEAGGAQKAMLELATGLRRRGHGVTVVTMYDKADFIPLFEARYDMPIINLNMKQPQKKGAGRYLNVGKGLWQLRKLLQNVDVLQTFTHFSNIIVPFVGWVAGVPVRISSQRNLLHNMPFLIQQTDKWVVGSPLVQKMTMVSKGVHRYCLDEGFRADKLITIPNGIKINLYKENMPAFNIRHELNLPKDSLVITTIARLHSQKNHLIYLDAIAQIAPTLPHAHFLFAGDGELQAQIEAKIAKLGLEKCVHLLGTRSDVPALLSASDLFVLPSRREGMPNSVLEAMASKLAVVATEIAGSSELVVHDKTGLLVPPNNPHALTTAISTLLTNKTKRDKMGIHGRQRATDFSLDNTITRYETLYLNLLQK